MLPLVPPEDVFWSPYSGLDALCGNTLMISLDELVKDGLLEKSDLPKEVPVTTADFFKVHFVNLFPNSGMHTGMACVSAVPPQSEGFACIVTPHQ